MNSVFAFIVGIEKYDQPRWDVVGPCASALAIAKWILSAGVPAQNVFLFLELAQDLDELILQLKAKQVRIRSAKLDDIDTFWRGQLSNERPANSRLFIYWSGHGFAENDGSRIFICRDYTDAKLRNRVFNASNFLRYLRSDDFQCFSEQIFLADVCGIYSGLEFSADKNPPKKLVKTARQVAWFATPEGQYAKGGEGRGVFSDVVLNVLRQSKDWPKPDLFSKALREAFQNVGQTPFRVSGHDGEGEWQDHLVGSIPNLSNALLESKSTAGLFFGPAHKIGDRTSYTGSKYRLAPYLLERINDNELGEFADDVAEPRISNLEAATNLIREPIFAKGILERGEKNLEFLQAFLSLEKKNNNNTVIRLYGNFTSLATDRSLGVSQSDYNYLIVEETRIIERFIREGFEVRVCANLDLEHILKTWTSKDRYLTRVEVMIQKLRVLEMKYHNLRVTLDFRKRMDGVIILGGSLLILSLAPRYNKGYELSFYDNDRTRIGDHIRRFDFIFFERLRLEYEIRSVLRIPTVADYVSFVATQRIQRIEGNGISPRK